MHAIQKNNRPNRIKKITFYVQYTSPTNRKTKTNKKNRLKFFNFSLNSYFTNNFAPKANNTLLFQKQNYVLMLKLIVLLTKI